MCVWPGGGGGISLFMRPRFPDLPYFFASTLKFLKTSDKFVGQKLLDKVNTRAFSEITFYFCRIP